MISIRELRQNLPFVSSVGKCENFLTESGVEETVTIVIVFLHFRERRRGVHGLLIVREANATTPTASTPEDGNK